MLLSWFPSRNSTSVCLEIIVLLAVKFSRVIASKVSHLCKSLHGVIHDFQNIFSLYPMLPATECSEIPEMFNPLVLKNTNSSPCCFSTLILSACNLGLSLHWADWHVKEPTTVFCEAATE